MHCVYMGNVIIENNRRGGGGGGAAHGIKTRRHQVGKILNPSRQNTNLDIGRKIITYLIGGD